jgi:tRNA threonylcarbamoyladenosine biosynthesis protein TsaB
MSDAFSLVFETSTPEASIALVDADGVSAERRFCSDRNHNAMLFGPLSELMDEARKRGIERVLVGSGPGSYSGTRVGIAAAQGVAIALGCPAVAVASILAVPCAEDGAPCLAIGDARRGSFWSARVENSVMAGEPELCNAEGLGEAVSRALSDGLAVFAFEEAARFPLAEEIVAGIRREFPDAARLWKVWLAAGDNARRAWSAEPPQPLYLKPPHITPAKRPPLLRF